MLLSFQILALSNAGESCDAELRSLLAGRIRCLVERLSKYVWCESILNVASKLFKAEKNVQLVISDIASGIGELVCLIHVECHDMGVSKAIQVGNARVFFEVLDLNMTVLTCLQHSSKTVS